MADGERSTSGAGGGEESQLAIGGNEQRHPCNGEVRDREEPPLSKKFASSPPLLQFLINHLLVLFSDLLLPCACSLQI